MMLPHAEATGWGFIMKAWPLGRFWVSGGQSFCYFAILPSRASNLEEEWGHFVMVMFAATAKMIGTQGPVRRNHLGCPRACLSSL